MALKEREAYRQSREAAWKNPLVLAILTAALAAAGNAAVSYIGARQQHELEAIKAEAARILEMIKTDDTEQAARNLGFLVDTGLVDNIRVREKLAAFLKTRKPENSPSLPSPTPSTPSFLTQRERQEILGGPTIHNSSEQNRQILLDDPWIKANIIEIDVPQLRKISEGRTNGKIKFHKAAAPSLINAFSEIEERGLLADILSFDAAFVPRTIRGTVNLLSSHALGIAVDLNASWNPYGSPPAPSEQKGSLLRVVPILEKHGFAWNGRSTLRPDGMHFEFADRATLLGKD